MTRGMNIDDVCTTELRRRIIQEKNFLRRIYQEWYTRIAAALPGGKEHVLELGAGAGFLSDFVPGLIISDVLKCSGMSIVMDACQQFPFLDESLRGIVLVNVFHHLPQPSFFLREAARCVRTGGVVVMIEPWVTRWSRFVYTKLHHEPFDPAARQWKFPVCGPLSGANGAMPWIIFERDRAKLEKLFPAWKIDEIKPMMPFRYLISGGVALRSLMPGWTFGIWRFIEDLLHPWMKIWAMFAKITLRKVAIADDDLSLKPEEG
ncbi:MAG: methyltransferase domain-containing protein [Methanotrichaceae archaeon]|nr:methyltransferase domain-containing protein [Methanotrichaceae archaeon]